jgi:hypothetical protein
MPQAVPLALVAPTRPGLTNVGYLVRSASAYNTILTNWTAVSEQGTNTGYYPVTSVVSVPDAGAIVEFRQTSNTGTFLSAVTVDPVPANFTDMAITASTGQVTVGTNADKTGYSLSSSQTFNLTGNITGNLSGSVGSVTGAVGSVTGAVGSVTGAVGSVTGAVTVGTINNNVITANSINSGAITNAKFAAGAIDAAAIATDAVTEIQTGLATQASVDTKASQASVDALNAKADDITALVL